MLEKYYKKQKTRNIIKIEFKNYLKSNLYISLDFYKRDKVYKLTWVNMDLEDPIKNMNVEVLDDITANHVLTLLINRPLVEMPTKKLTDIDKVEVTVSCACLSNSGSNFEYNRYIPKEFLFLVEPFLIISKCLPTKLDHYFVMTLASVTGDEYKYDYLNAVKLNVLRDNIDKLFQPKIIEVGKLLNNNIKFIEKVDRNYYALIEDLVDYAVIVKEDEKNRMILNCTCPRDYYCEHIYATLSAIRNKEEKPFYKVVYNDQKADLLDKMTNNKVVLATGVKDDKIQLINDMGQLGLLPVISEEKKCNWTVMKDDEQNSLTEALEKLEDASNDL